MTKYKGSIHIDDVRDGQNGRDAVTLVVTPSVISVDTKADGTVDESCLKDARALVRAYAGGKPVQLAVQQVEKSDGIDATASRVDNSMTGVGVRITGIAADATGYAVASGSVTVTLLAESTGIRQNVTAVIGIVTTLHRVTAEIVKDNTGIRQSVTDLTRTFGFYQSRTQTSLASLSGLIQGKVNRTDYDADKQAQSLRETELKQTVDDIALTVRNRGNLLRGTGFRNRRTLPELTGDAVWSDAEADLYGSHGVVHVPMSTDAAQRNAGMRYLIPRSAVQNGRSYTLSVAVLVKDTADLSNISSEQYYVKADRQTRIGGMIKYETWEAQAFSAGSWRRVAVTFAPDFTKAAGGEYLELRFALYGKGEVWFAEPQFEMGTTATPWMPNVNDADENLQDTALEIKNRKIVATADNFVIRNNDGVETAAVNRDGTLNANLINAKSVRTGSLTGGQPHTVIDGPTFEIYGNGPFAAVRLAVNSDGQTVLRFCNDQTGEVLYDLGPNGIMKEVMESASSTQRYGLKYVTADSGGVLDFLQHAPTTSYYLYHEGFKRVGNAVKYNYSGTSTPSDKDGKLLTGEDPSSQIAEGGWYTAATWADIDRGAVSGQPSQVPLEFIQYNDGRAIDRRKVWYDSDGIIYDENKTAHYEGLYTYLS